MLSDRLAVLRSISPCLFPMVLTDKDSVDAIRSYHAAGLVIAVFDEDRTQHAVHVTAEVFSVTREGQKALEASDLDKTARRRRSR